MVNFLIVVSPQSSICSLLIWQDMMQICPDCLVSNCTEQVPQRSPDVIFPLYPGLDLLRNLNLFFELLGHGALPSRFQLCQLRADPFQVFCPELSADKRLSCNQLPQSTQQDAPAVSLCYSDRAAYQNLSASSGLWLLHGS